MSCDLTPPRCFERLLGFLLALPVSPRVDRAELAAEAPTLPRQVKWETTLLAVLSLQLLRLWLYFLRHVAHLSSSRSFPVVQQET